MARRRRARGLPAAGWVGRGSRVRRKRRSPFVLSLLIHGILAAVVVFALSTATSRNEPIDPSMAVEFVAPLRDELRPDRPLKRVARLTQAAPEAPDWQQVASRTLQTIEFSARSILRAADPVAPDIATDVVVTTNARTRTDDRRLSSVRSLSSKPVGGQGVVTGVNRPKGVEGRNIADSSGASPLGLPGSGSGQSLEATTASPQFRDALARIGSNIAASNITGKVDIVLVIDTSGSMGDNIGAVADYLFAVTDLLEQADVDYRLGLAAFRQLSTGSTLDISGWTVDAQTLRTRMRSLGIVGDESALDALAQTLNQTRFRADADRSMILVTDEPATTRWSSGGASDALRARVLRDATRAGVRVEVLGYGEGFQLDLAKQTGGLFQVIPSADRESRRAAGEPVARPLAANALEGGFRDIAGDVRRWVNLDGGDVTRVLDVVLFVDVSRSMQGRLRAAMQGVSIFDSALRVSGVEPAYALARFGAADGVSGASVAGVDISYPHTDVPSMQRLLQRPAIGTEYLWDAIGPGLSKPLRQNVPRVSIIVTDEPPSGANVTPDEAVQTMRDSGMRFYAFLPWPPSGTRGDPPLHALHETVRASGGKVFAMPNAHYERRRDE